MSVTDRMLTTLTTVTIARHAADPHSRAWFTGQPAQLLGEWGLTVGGSALLLVWLVVQLAMPILIERMSA
jgi:hypothetical protein